MLPHLQFQHNSAQFPSIRKCASAPATGQEKLATMMLHRIQHSSSRPLGRQSPASCSSTRAGAAAALPRHPTASRRPAARGVLLPGRATADNEFRPASPPQQQDQGMQQQQQQKSPEPSASSASSGCPFHDAPGGSSLAEAPQQQQQRGGNASDKAAPVILGASGTNVAGMHGPGWRVLSPTDAAARQAPEPPCRPVAVDGSNPMGELGDFGQLGAGAFFINRYKQFGPVFSWQMGPLKMITLLDYEAIRSLLAADNKVVVGWNPESLYAMVGERVRQTMENPGIRVASRRMLQPGFTHEALAGYIGKLEAICRTQLDEWSFAEGPVDLAARAKDLSFEFSTQLLVDFRVSAEQKPALREKFDKLFTGMFSPPDPTPGSAFCLGIEARHELLIDLAELVKQREERRAAEAAGGSAAGGSGSQQQGALHRNVLDYVLADMRTWNDQGTIDYQDAADAGIGLLIGGNDTSGLGVGALLATLPFFPDVLGKLRAEQEKVIAKHGPKLTPAALDAMTFANAVIKEVLRVTPPSASVFRKTTVDMEVCGKFIPAGSPILLSTFLAQILTDPHLMPSVASLSRAELDRLEANWQSVNASLLRQEFRPERWLQGSKERTPSGLLTFSAGPHTCIGMGLFMTEAKVLLALLGRDYDIILVDDSADVSFHMLFVNHLAKGVVRFTKTLTAAAA